MHHQTTFLQAQVWTTSRSLVDTMIMLTFEQDDGSVRVYNQETLKVVKAIRGLGEVSSIVCMPHNTGSLGDIWVASVRHVCL
jgi:hypothetical protein